jgi:hypothetical protein
MALKSRPEENFVGINQLLSIEQQWPLSPWVEGMNGPMGSLNTFFNATSMLPTGVYF